VQGSGFRVLGCWVQGSGCWGDLPGEHPPSERADPAGVTLLGPFGSIRSVRAFRIDGNSVRID
jgi:hypothetical protein